MNRLVYAALREVEVLAHLVTIEGESLSAARAMGLFFDDCRDTEVLFGASNVLAESVERLRAERGETDPHDQMLALAGTILSHNSFEYSQIMPGVSPFSWFVNLESLFEEAVRHRMRMVVAGGTNVYKAQATRPPIFPLTGLHRAVPDLVIQSDSRKVVGDVKYKDWTGSASAPDLYQLLVHAKAFDADHCFLVFPSDQYSEVCLGPSVTGAITWLFAVDVRDLDLGLQYACRSMSIASRAAND